MHVCMYMCVCVCVYTAVAAFRRTHELSDIQLEFYLVTVVLRGFFISGDGHFECQYWQIGYTVTAMKCPYGVRGGWHVLCVRYYLCCKHRLSW